MPQWSSGGPYANATRAIAKYRSRPPFEIPLAKREPVRPGLENSLHICEGSMSIGARRDFGPPGVGIIGCNLQKVLQAPGSRITRPSSVGRATQRRAMPPCVLPRI